MAAEVFHVVATSRFVGEKGRLSRNEFVVRWTSAIVEDLLGDRGLV